MPLDSSALHHENPQNGSGTMPHSLPNLLKQGFLSPHYQFLSPFLLSHCRLLRLLMTDSLPPWYALPPCNRQVGGLGGILLKLDNYLE